MVTKQSKRRTGFDYWLGEKKDILGFKDLARLEVSGILRGSNGQINQRLKEKIDQTKKSDNLGLPAYVVIVEFSQLQVKIAKTVRALRNGKYELCYRGITSEGYEFS